MPVALDIQSITHRVDEKSRRAAARAINRWAKKVHDRAVVYAPIGPPVRNERGQFAPRVPDELGEVHPGHLKRSAVLEEATAVRLVAEVAFTAVYAARQHEELTWKHPQGGMPKYLETAFKELLPELAATVAAEMRVEFGS